MPLDHTGREQGRERSIDVASPEAAVLVGVQLPVESDEEAAESLLELEALATTAGARVEASIVQRRKKYDAATLLGAGKVAEVRTAVDSLEADLVILDNELTVSQQDRLQSMLGVRVIDRTALILDIFAQHAYTREGRTQVELAQLSYFFPRIRGKGIELSRLGGGIGTRRGPGETQLEVDRRSIRRRMRKLEGDLDRMEAVRATQRKQRTRAGLPAVCLVGYTNSGKSTLLNRLTGASVLVEDRLFSTLDSTTRKLALPDGRKLVLSDTVGFIRKLPHELIAAFRSTLEVVREAEILVHVVSAVGEETLADRIGAVGEVLADLDASEITTITVLNKSDRLEHGERKLLQRRYPDALITSALTGEGIDELLEAIGSRLESAVRLSLSIPAGEGGVLASLYRDGSVLSSENDGDLVLVEVEMPPEKVNRYDRYRAGRIQPE